MILALTVKFEESLNSSLKGHCVDSTVTVEPSDLTQNPPEHGVQSRFCNNSPSDVILCTWEEDSARTVGKTDRAA